MSDAAESASKERSLNWTALTIVALGVAVARLLAVRSFPIYDDAFITWRYASNFAAGHGLVFNPGASWEPILGTTTPGYACLLAALARLGASIEHASLALNIACDTASAVLICLLLDRRSTASFIAVAAFLATPEIARVSVGGMESPLFACLALAASYAARSQRLSVAGVLAALTCTVRPEGVLLVALLAAFHVRSLRAAFAFGAPVVLIGAAYAAALSAYFGDPIPQSIKAKADFYGLGPRLARGASVLSQALGPSLATRIAAPLALVGFVVAFTWKSGARAFVAFALAMTAAYALSGTKTWGWYFYVPLVGWSVALGLGAEALVDFAVRARPSWARAKPFVGTNVFRIAIVAVVLWSRMVADKVTPSVYERMRAWSQRAGASSATICASDIGAIAWFSGARILDSEGLVWPEGRGYANQAALVREHRPEYVLLVANQARTPAFLGDEVAASYETIERFSARGESELAPDLAALPEGWVQDYLLLRRRD